MTGAECISVDGAEGSRAVPTWTETPNPKAIDNGTRNRRLIACQQRVRGAYRYGRQLEASSSQDAQPSRPCGADGGRRLRNGGWPFLSDSGSSNLAGSRSPLCEQMLLRSRLPRTARGESMIHETSLDRSGRRQKSDSALLLQGYIPVAHTIPF